jgi:hypothetical protein
MKLLLPLLFCLPLCKLNAQLEFYDCPKEKKHEYVSNARLFPKYLLGNDTLYHNWKIDTGNAIVLKYEHHYDCSGTGHLGVIASFLWSIPKASTTFEIQLNKIDSLQTPVLYVTGCGPPCRKYNFEMTQVDGVIRGELINKVWQVTGIIKMVLYNRSSKVSASKDLMIDGAYVSWKQKRKDKKVHKFNGF